MNKRITYDQLERALLQLGLKVYGPISGHKVFRDNQGKHILAVPVGSPREQVDIVYVRVAAKTVDELGLCTPEEFEQLLAGGRLANPSTTSGGTLADERE